MAAIWTADGSDGVEGGTTSEALGAGYPASRRAAAVARVVQTFMVGELGFMGASSPSSIEGPHFRVTVMLRPVRLEVDVVITCVPSGDNAGRPQPSLIRWPAAPTHHIA